ncbi:IclR family transcriptional regulator [Kineococcus glutinatus]|uniref:IclR family transcriptional regulator n=1 Tax=Kineococcus glutinatus TaxID=1070872 RepID=A0ABP9HUC7_9ACTN
MAGGSSQPGRTVTARALAVLFAFDEDHSHLSLSEIARRAGLPLTTAHRIVGELEQAQALERLEDGVYVVGRRMWQLGLLAPTHRELRESSLPFMEDLYAATGENVHLAVREGTSALYVERLHGRRSVPLVSRAGVRLPLHATGVGKVLLAHAPADVVREVLAQPERITGHTITEAGRLQRELAAVRRNGYASTAEEMTLGTCSVAVPVRGSGGEVGAALGVVGTTTRRGLLALLPALRVAAAAITRATGEPPRPAS